MTRSKRSIRSLSTLLVAFALAAVFAACGSSSSSSSSSSTANTSAGNAPTRGFSGDAAVSIKNFAYNPNPITVSKGTTVTWTNNDTAPHTATAASGSFTFDTGRLANGASKAITFNTPGTFAYTCTIHPSMKGSITVTG
jgi:plastocyanin